MNRTLIATCWFNIAAGSWLGLMEVILRHDGYAGRAAMMVGVALVSLLTILFATSGRNPVLRGAVLAGAVAIFYLGASAVVRVLNSSHFEGYVLVIGTTLAVQGGLTLAALWPRVSAAQ
jgi:hypothetical protein